MFPLSLWFRHSWGALPQHSDMNKPSYKKIEGKLPEKREIVDWDETKLHQYLKFVDFFTEGDKFNFSPSHFATAKRRAQDELFWDEFLMRINAEPGDKGFRQRFNTQHRVILSWVKENPHVLTTEMYNLMCKSPRLSWAVKHFKTVETEMGVVVVERDLDETTDPNNINAQPGLQNVKSPQLIYEESLYSLTTLFRSLVKSVPMSDLKTITPTKRIELANQLARTLAANFSKYKPNIAVFQNININKGKREELESAIHEYAETQE